MSIKYTDHIVGVHKTFGRTHHISRFVELVDHQALGLGSKADCYAPIRFNIQACGSITHPGGTIRMDIPVHANKNWYTELKQKLAGTLGISSRAYIELRTVTGKPLDAVESKHLDRVGNLNIYVDGKQKRFDKMPTVPVEYSVTKRHEIQKWQREALRDLPKKIADELHNKSIVEVNNALLAEGSVQQLIEKHLIAVCAKHNSGSWTEFARVHNTTSPKKMVESDAGVILRNVSTHLLGAVRDFVGASEERIKKHINAMEAASYKGKSKHTTAVLGAAAASSSSKENGHEMYHTLFEQAFKVPTLERAIINSVFRAPMVSVMDKRRAELVPVRKIASHHPWYAQIHSMLPVRGTYPPNYIAHHTKRDMSINAPYPRGDLAKTYRAYHLFSGQHIAPDSIVLQGVGCGLKKKKKRSKNMDSVESHVPSRREEMPKRNKNAKRKPSRVARDVAEHHPGLIAYSSESASRSPSSTSSGSESEDNYMISIRSKPTTSRIAPPPKTSFVADDQDDLDAEEDPFPDLPSVKDAFK